MASYRKRNDSWRAEVAVRGVRETATWPTKAQAVAWATALEAEIIAGARNKTPNKTLGDLLQKYAEEVSPTKRGERTELIRIKRLQRDQIAQVSLRDLDATDIASWRDRRLRGGKIMVDGQVTEIPKVSAASVRREWTLLSHALKIAVDEWKWLSVNPMKTVRRPAAPPARDRRISADELERLCFALGWDGQKVDTVTARVGAAMMFAVETAMRAGEIASLTWNHVDQETRVAHLDKTKNGTKREVPLSLAAIAIVKAMAGVDEASVFKLTVQQIDVLFRKAKARALIEELHFHDTRAEAITRLAKKLDILPLARMVGHRNLAQLQVYYRESAADMVRSLDR